MFRHPTMLSRVKTGLLIIDMQEKFAPAIPGFDKLVANIGMLVQTFQMFKMPIIVTEQYPKGLGNTVTSIRKHFKLLEVIEKNEFACTRVPSFWSSIRTLDISTLLVTGVETHVCVSQTVLELIQHGLSTHVAVDAVSSRFELDHDLALRKMEKAGAIMGSTEMYMFELLEKAGTESFKVVSSLIKNKGKSVTDSKEPTTTAKVPVSKSDPISQGSEKNTSQEIKNLTDEKVEKKETEILQSDKVDETPNLDNSELKDEIAKEEEVEQSLSNDNKTESNPIKDNNDMSDQDLMSSISELDIDSLLGGGDK